ncbi:MAG: proprotein convertase P-domain-containing protein [Candidatus Eisenbacteria sp.]|nr:proprotein convertase P-domain-containing protein [Candidatus Eisenbacteria bacterium]
MRFSQALFVSLVLLAAAAVAAPAAVRTLPLVADETHLSLVEQRDDGLRYQVEVGELVGMDVTTKQGEFTRLFIPGFHASHDEGAPELPMMNRLIEIPFGSTARIEVISAESRSIDLAAHGIEHPLFPAQPSMPKNADPETWPFVYDAASYNVSRVARELVDVVPQGRLRGVEFGRLELSPVEYYPTENRLVVHDRIEFRVVFEGGDPSAEAELKARTRSLFFEGLYQSFDGYRGEHDSYPDLVGDVVTMVVVTPPDFAPYMQEFVDWKTERGFHTILAVTGTPEVGSTTTSIQSYIHDLYNNATPELPAPSFVLFVGDVAEMPTFYEAGDATDRPYCAVDGDVVPDIYYGRFSATSPTMLQDILDKTLMYDQFTMPNPNYLGEVVMIAGMDASHGSTWGNGQINYGTGYYFNAAHGITSHTYLYPESGSHAADIVQNVSDGVAYINYTAHGGTTNWSDPSFTQSDLAGLTNVGEYCLAVGNCCLTSSYDVGECFAESWLRAANKGAIGYIGGSNSTYWDEDYWWGVGHTASIVADPTYEGSGLGAYDGLFHDHGEAMTQWYVTNDAIIFAGNLAVQESGSSRTTFYWNIYNLMGDPSLSTYLGVPSVNPVTHPETIFTTWTSFTVEADPGSYVGLTKNGDLIGAGTVDETGSIDLPIWADPLLPGSAKLVVMAQNREPYIANLNVIVPAQVFINPDVIDANVETEISVGVFEYDGVTPRDGVEVWADGLDYESVHEFTEADGYCTITVNYPYGPTLDIVGKDPLEPWELFREAITVNALALGTPDLWATTGIGLNDTLALNLPGTLHMSVLEPGCTLWAFLNGELVGSTSVDDYFDLIPDETGEVTGTIALSGHDLYTEDFPVIEAYGTLTGHVDAAGSPAVGAIVRGYDDLANLIFEVTADGLGNYDVGEEILVQDYTVMCDYFGYLHWEQAYFLNYGANVLDITMIAAPAGVITGTITETGTGLPLEATVKLYRSDTMELYAQTTSDPVDGSYTTPSLPYFEYVMNVKAWHHIPVTTNVTIDQPVHPMNFELEETIGDLLVIDDSAKRADREAKRDPKTGEVIAPACTREPTKAVADLMTDLENLGYTATLETMAATDPLMWENYDLLVVSCGDNVFTLDDVDFRNSLEDFVLAGGHLLVEGGEVGYDWQSSYGGDPEFAAAVLHVTDWNSDNGGNVTVADAGHYVMSVPNVIAGPITVSSNDYGDQDALVPTADAAIVGSWTDHPSDASVIAYDANPAPAGGQFVLFAFNYSMMDAGVRPLLLQNTVTWLMTPEIGDCSVSGTVHLAGESDHSGVKVEAIPGGGSDYTNVLGEYTLPGLYAGPYTIRATKGGWSVGNEEVMLSEGEDLTGVDFLLTVVYQAEHCERPNLAIPDNDPGGADDAMMFYVGSTISAVQVFMDITHTYIGDLTVELTSPAGTRVMLHDRSGGSTDNLSGWYPADLDPAGDLDDYIGESTDGLWKVMVIDHASYDTGTVDEWCVRMTHAAPAAVGDESLPGVLALWANRPNPVHRQTAIRFDLPQAGPVDLAVFDVTGRRVKTLVSGDLKAGSYQTVWQGTDSEGNPVSSAVYFYRLKSDGETLTKKMMVLN